MHNTVMICGPNTINQDQFNRYYKPLIEQYALKDYTFIVGGETATDIAAQHLLHAQHVKDVIVYDKRDNNNNMYPNSFKHKNGYASTIDKYIAMSDAADHNIIYLYRHHTSYSSEGFATLVYRTTHDRNLTARFIDYARKCIIDPIDTYHELTDEQIIMLHNIAVNVMVL